MKTMKKALAILLSLVLCMNLGISVLGAGDFNPDANGLVTVSGVTAVPNSTAYYNDAVKKVIIEEGVTTIGRYAFGGCTNLSEVHLPLSLTTVDSAAFSGCSSLTTVYYAGTEAQKANISFANLTTEIQNANWIYLGSEGGDGEDPDLGGDTEPDPEPEPDPDPVPGAELKLSIAAATVIAGETAVVQLKLDSACSRLGAQLKLSASDTAGNTLPISSVVLGVDGASNDQNNGTMVFATADDLAAGTLLATVSFDTTTAGSYTLNLEGDIYTGADNSPADWSLSAGKITVKEPTVSVKWLNHDGSELDKQTVNIGTLPVYGGETPTRDSDRLYDYSFSGWDKASAAVYTDTVYIAQFSKTARSYTVTIDCGIEGAEYSITNSNGIALTPAADGSFRLSATETYICSVSAVGCVETSFSLSIADESADWSFSGSSAVLSIAAPEAHIGDVDDNGTVDMRDAQALFNYLAGNISLGSDGIAYSAAGAVIFNSNVADINSSGSVGADDILPMLDLVNE